MERVSGDWVRKYLLCCFSYYDLCLKGLCIKDGEYFICELEDYDNVESFYIINLVKLDDECLEYLSDYKKSYHHWFYENGKRQNYDGRDLSWFSNKWKENPILKIQY